MVKILVVSHSCLSSSARLKLLELIKFGYNIGLVLPSNWISKDFSSSMLISPTNLEKEIKFFTAPVIRSGHPASHFYPPGWLKYVLMRFKPDIVQVEQEIFSPVSAEVSLWLHLTSTKYINLGFENIRRKLCTSQLLLKKIVINRADALICRNQEGAAISQEEGFRGPILIAPVVGVDPNLFSPELRKLSNSVMTIGFAGRLVREKGADILIKAAKELQKSNIRLKLLFIGDGPEKGNLQKLAYDLELESDIEWKGYCPFEKMPDAMSEIDALVLPSRSTTNWWEQFGMVLAQAMMMGIPVIGSDCGAIPDVIARKDAVFREEDVFGLSELLRRLVEDDRWREDLSIHNRQRALTNYSNQALANQYQKLYRKLLSVKKIDQEGLR